MSELAGPPAFDEGLSSLAAAATAMHELFITYVAAGFTEDQALQLLGFFLGGLARPGGAA